MYTIGQRDGPRWSAKKRGHAVLRPGAADAIRSRWLCLEKNAAEGEEENGSRIEIEHPEGKKK